MGFSGPRVNPGGSGAFAECVSSCDSERAIHTYRRRNPYVSSPNAGIHTYRRPRPLIRPRARPPPWFFQMQESIRTYVYLTAPAQVCPIPRPSAAMANPPGIGKSCWCSACQRVEVSSKWHREAGELVCHRVYQQNRKASRREAEGAAAPSSPVATSPRKPSPSSPVKGSPGGGGAVVASRGKPGGGSQSRAAQEAAAPSSKSSEAQGAEKPTIHTCPRPAKRSRRSACLEELYFSELAYGLGNKSTLESLETQLGYKPCALSSDIS